MQLLERDEALRELNAALKDAAAGQGRTVLVSGEAGIGKTALIERFTAIHGTATRVLWSACDALFTPRPLGPLHDIAAQIQGDLLPLLMTEANRTIIFSTFLNELQQRPSIAVVHPSRSSRTYTGRTKPRSICSNSWAAAFSACHPF